jgi:CheY-like chemotaxis protein
MLRAAWGCEVVVAASLQEAKQALDARSTEFVAAVCDLHLPDAPHGEVIDLVVQYGVPAIAVTGSFGEQLRDMVVKKGVVDYVLKDSINAYDYIVQLVGRLHKNAAIKVLITDDSPSLRALLKYMLDTQRLNVYCAEDGQQALDILEQHPDIKLVLVDYNMPRVDGFTFVLEARKKTGKEHLAIIGLSAESNSNISGEHQGSE